MRMHDSQPLVVSYGMGVDSTALLVLLYLLRIKPDLILTADTGGEKPETYAYEPIIAEWLASVGFPPITWVRYQPKTAPYHTLEDKCLANEGLPSLAYGRHSCSLFFKVAPQEKYLRTWPPALLAWAMGIPVLKAIGYDAGPADKRRRAKADARNAEKPDARWAYTYPLQEYGISRAGCIDLIRSAGLPVPPKSACFFCPGSKKSEVLWLRDTHPSLFARAIAIEHTARHGKHGLRSVQGLGRRFAWLDLAHASSVTDDDASILRP